MGKVDIQPVFEQESIPIVFTCDNRYAVFVGVAVQNIIEYANQARNYDIVILELGLDAEIKKAIIGQVASYANISVRFFDVTESIAAYSLDSMSMVKRFPKEVFLPVFIPFLFQRYKKVLCIDADIVIMRDIAELYDVDLGDNLIGAVVDYECTIETWLRDAMKMHYRSYIVKKLGVELLHFFNSGVLSFNMAQIMREGLVDSFAEAIPAFFRLPDQDILNHACRGRVKFLDPAWNVQAFAYTKKLFAKLPKDKQDFFYALREKAKIMHYTYVIKPWFHASCTRWWRIARKTPFYEKITTEFLQNSEINPFIKEWKKPKKSIMVKLDR